MTAGVATTQDAAAQTSTGVTIKGSVYGGGNAADVKVNTVVNIGGGNVEGNVYGGGKIGSVGTFTYYTGDGINASNYISSCADGTGTATVNISGGTVGNEDEYTYDANNTLKHTSGGNVFAGSKGKLEEEGSTAANPLYVADWYKHARVKNTVLTVSGGIIKSNVYGGGEIGAVGFGTSYGDSKTTDIRISGGTIGTEIQSGSGSEAATQYTFGSVFGAGYGSNLETTIAGQTDPNAPKLFAGRVYGNTSVLMTDGTVKASVYGGGELASVSGNATVAVSGGTIGKAKVGDKQFGGPTMGNVYGGGSGDKNIVRAGQIFGNTTVNISQASGKTTNIYHNIYGGGAYGSVGTYTYTTTTTDPNYPGIEKVNGINSCTAGTGTATVTITGGTIGTDGIENGMIFGSSRGDVGAPGSRDDLVAWVNTANVTIETESSTTGPTIKGSVYGSGENGHTLGNTDVKVHSGTIGVHDGSAADKTRGNVYGGGCGTDKYYSTGTEKYDGKGDSYNPKAGIVQGTATVTIDGGHVLHNVYGAGAMGSVGGGTTTDAGKTTVTISGGRIGYDGNENGNVFGAARGEYGTSTDLSKNLANVRETEVNINYTTTPTGDNDDKDVQLIAGSVFGGGESGTVKESVAVNMTGGLILKDIYGGGALADTQTSNWDASANSGAGGWATGKSSSSSTTTVRLTGGRIVEEAYGGGLGEAGKPAYVWGDVLVDLNGTTTMDNTTHKPTVNGTATTNAVGCVVGQVFGANNINGTPKGDVMVHVYATQNKDASKTTIDAKFLNSNVNLNSLTLAKLQTGLADKIAIAAKFDDITVSTETTALVSAAEPTDEDELNELKASIKTAINNLAEKIGEKTSDADQEKINALIYDVKAVYGGGNQAAYVPVTPNTSTTAANGPKSQVIIEGCNLTSIETVYGGGNAAAVPETNVEVRSAYEIGYVFGGGNGYSATNNHTDPTAANYNPGADIGVYKVGNTETTYGTGDANAILKGGFIHEAYGGSNQKGNIKGKININTNPQGTCDLCVDKLVGAGKNADVDGDLIMILGCKPTTKTPLVFAGADNADVNGNVELTITSGTFGQVFGGNNEGGAIKGHIKLNIEETGCNPIVIDELYLGGNQAAYSRYGYYEDTSDNNKVKPRTAEMHAITDPTATGYVAPLTNPSNTDGKHPFPYAEPVLNVISCTSIGKVFGGGLGEGAVMHANPTVNINMIKGTATNSLSTIGTIGNVFGGGNAADVYGNPTVNIGTEKEVQLHQSVDANGNYTMSGNQTVLGAHITGDVFGGGNQAEVIGNTTVYICAVKGDDPTTTDVTEEYHSVAPGTAGVTIEGTQPEGGFGRGVFGGGNQGNVSGDSYVYFGGGAVNQTIYGGGCVADVKGNTHVTMLDGYVFDGVCGGGLKGSVGTILTRTTVTGHTKGSTHDNGEICIGGKPETFKENTGKCTVKITGGQIGPATVATDGMTAAGGPVSEGWVWGAGRGAVVGPDTDPDTDFRTYVYETDVTIGGTAFIMEGIVGGGEFGRVRHNTWVKIQDHCQIGVGAGTDMVDSSGKPIRYTDGYDYGNGVTTNQFVDPTETGITETNALKACSHFPFGKEGVYKVYDPYADEFNDPYPGGSTANASDGKTWIGCVFAGGSGYFPYKKKDNSGYDWLQSAGLVEGDAKIEITGGHILTNVYGGNEVTNVLGKSTVKMSGGTIGVPRTKEQIEALPMCGYIYGAGKGDERIHFNTSTNVGSAEVEVSGGIVYGSVYGGGEDGHVLGDVTVTIKEGAKIGSCGTSYFDGHVFGGGRGFSGIAQTAGTVGGNVTLNIEGGTMLGSVYGGGRLASVGTMFEFPTLTNGDPNPAYSQFKKDGDGKTYGHVTVNISGGTIGNAAATGDGVKYSGNVFGGSMGRLELLNGTRNPIWAKMAQVKSTAVNIYDEAVVRRNVFGGGELGTVRDDAYVTIGGYKTDDANTNGEVPITTSLGTSGSGPIVRRDVYGGGYGSDNKTHNIFSVYELTDADADPSVPANYDTNPHTYAYTPMQFAGCVGKNTYVNVVGGYIRKNVYGGGEMASVGVINYRAAEATSTPDADKVTIGPIDGKTYYYENMVKHGNPANGFALSWPYKFNYVDGYPGATHVNITGGRLGLKDGDTDTGFEDNGDVYGAGKGKAGDYNDYLFCANVGSTDVKIAYTSTPEAYTGNGDLIAGAVYGGGEDGHVMGDTKLTISGGLIYHSVYGGGSGKGKFSRKLLPTGTNYEGATDADYVTRDAYSITAGKVFGNTEVDMSGGYVVRNIYGGGNMGSVGKGNYAGGTGDYSTNGYGEKVANLWSNTDFTGSGKCTVNITGGTIGYIDTTTPSNSMYPYNSPASLPYGNVFGGCRGEAVPNITDSPRYYYCPEFFVGYANETEVTIEGTNTKILGSVYGGGMDGHIRRDAHVIITGGEIGIPFDATNKTNVKTEDPNNIQWLARGNVYGAGSGIGKYGDEFCTSAGSVTRFTKVDIQGGTIHRNVYGGGSLASIGAPKIPADRTDNPTKEQSQNQVTISGGQIGGDYSYNEGVHVYGGHVFGGSRGEASLRNSTLSYSTSMFTSVTVNANATPANSPIIEGSVFGGGEVGIVKGSVDVNINGGTINDDVYGGGALANTNTANVTSGYGTDSEVIGSTSTYTTTVDLFGGLIKGDAYGGGLGQLGAASAGTHYTQAEIDAASEGDPAYGKTTDDWKEPPVAASDGTGAIKAKVYGDVTVTLGDDGRNGATAFYVDKYTEGTHAGIVKSGRVFGCNNLNGSPQGGVTVKVNKTEEGNTPKTASGKLKSETASDHTYHVAAVYGGGNLAGKTVGGITNVIINGCDVSIRQVYGGGNAAEVPGTDVLVNGSYEIEQVFGGGNGKDDYTLDGGTTWITNPGANVNGNTNTLMKGGLIHEAYGGSNEKGTITGSVSINTSDDRPTDCDCELDVEKIVGAGKNADVNGDLIMVLGCKPTSKTPLVFGGADNANVNGNVELTITSGTFGQVFGGNNLGGIIKGHILLNIEETGCNPIKIDELYLGGNQAAYSVYGYYDSGTTNPTTGKKIYLPRTSASDSHTEDPSHADDATHSFPYADPVLNVVSCTSIGKVFGGGLGEGAVMYADPTVNINMIPGAFASDDSKGVPFVMNEKGLSADDNPKKLGIIGDVYGGGNAADVIGNPTVNIGTAATVQLHQSYSTTTGYVMSDPIPVEGAYINGNVFGGGMGKEDEFTCAKAMVGEVDKGIDESNNPLHGGTNVVIGKGKVNGNVYGGGEVGRVERNTKVTIGREGAETSEAIIKGSVFGAGAGVETHGYSALVRGNAEVTIQGKAQVWKNVHGGGEKASVGRYNVRLPGDTEHPEVRVGMPYSLKAGGKCTVNIWDGATIGTEGDNETGHVYGAGQGITPVWKYTEYTSATPYIDRIKNSRRMVNYSSTDHKDEKQYKEWDYYVDDKGNQDTRYVWEYFTTQDDYLLYVETLARASETDVVIGGKRVTTETTSSITTSSEAPTVTGSVYGGSESGFVYYSTEINIPKGTVKGDVFGGGKGLDTFAEAGRVRRNTNLTISGGAVEGNVYGGGSFGDVGNIEKNADYNYKWKKVDGINYNTGENNKITGENTNTGICTVTISAGTIGIDNPAKPKEHGNVFGAGRGINDTWWCEKAMVFATNVNISAGTVKGNVYGGGEVGRVEDDAKVTIGEPNQTGETNTPIIKGNVFGAGAGLATHGYSALVRGNADVTLQGITKVGGSVYGGGEIASVGRFHVVGGLPTKPENGGYCDVTIQDNAVIGTEGDEETGFVFGACKGVTPAYDASNYKSVYSVQLYENRPSNTPGDTWDYYVTYPEGYTGQKFIKRYYKTETEYLAFLKTLALTSHPHIIIDEDVNVYGSVYGGGQRGVTLGHVDVDIMGGAISQDVYGGGALADTNLGNWDENGYVAATALNEGELITDLYTRSGSGTTESPFVYTKITDPTTNISSGTYYRQQGTWSDAATKSAHYTTKVNILGGTIGGDAYGGGLGQLEAGTKGADGYLAPIEAKVYGNVVMNLNGFDQTDVTYVPAIHGATTGENARLELVGNEYRVKDDVKGAIVRRIFGCNDLNGSPQGTVKVHVFKTQRAGQTRITNTDAVTTAKVHVTPVDGEYDVTSYDVQAVYGGGNMAAYVPKDLTDGKTQVIIDGCDRTSIGQVYGGGNAASTPATDVTVNGTFEIAEVFGGGNGKDKITINNIQKDNPGANVGFYDYSAEENIYNTKEKRTTDPELAPTFINKYVYGSGKAAVNIFGGTIHRVFGGSNTKGNVRQSAITLLEEVNDETGKPCCEFHVDEAYGGGKSAPMDAEAKLLMACIPGLKEAYGGAEAADVYDDVSVTITNGNFDRVFGGNNLSGTIRGKITVNVEETGCKPIVIGELYGGGNLAGYSIYGYKEVTENGKIVWKPRESATDAGTGPENPYDDPVVNVRSFTSIGNIFGGGYGEAAVMVGNPTVNINETVGSPDKYPTTGDYDDTGFKGKVITVGSDNHEVTLPSHTRGKIGAINNVFGGGNAAKVIGNTNVNIGTKSVETYVSIDDDAATADVKENVKAVTGADIRGNVYGGGNNAEVTGNTNVTIGQEKKTE